MAQQATSFVQEGVDRFNEARERIDAEVQRIQKEMKTRRKKLERQLNTSRNRFEKQTRKQVKQLEKEIQRNSLVKRAEELRVQATRQVESVVDTVLDALQIASKNDLQKIDRKLTRVNKKLREIEESRKTNGRRPPPGLFVRWLRSATRGASPWRTSAASISCGSTSCSRRRSSWPGPRCGPSCPGSSCLGCRNTSGRTAPSRWSWSRASRSSASSAPTWRATAAPE
jgi:hypothetical protein